jgi:ribosomal protein S21
MSEVTLRKESLDSALKRLRETAPRMRPLDLRKRNTIRAPALSVAKIRSGQEKQEKIPLKY